MVTVDFSVTSGSVIDVLVVDEVDYLKWIDGEDVHSPFPGGDGVGKASILFSLPHGGDWFFVWKNSNAFGVSGVSANVTWTGSVIEYIEVETNRPESEDYLALFGSFSLISGIVIIILSIGSLFVLPKKLGIITQVSTVKLIFAIPVDPSCNTTKKSTVWLPSGTLLIFMVNVFFKSVIQLEFEKLIGM